MIETKDLVKIYKSKTGVNVKALDKINLKLPSKGMVFILGKSGSGKSTLLNVLGGLDRYDEGEIIIKGKSSKDFKAEDFDSYRNTYVGFIFQEYNILDNFSVGQNIALAMKLQGKKPTSDDINNILKKVDLAGLAERKPNELSGGQKQRVAIARALIKEPQIIMADEPTGALDSNTGIQIFDTLKKLSEEKLVLIVSHDREFSERYADRIIEIKDGKVLSDVSIDKNLKREVENVIYNSNEILVKPEYTLTEKDLKEINAFLKKNKNNTKIKALESEMKGKGLFVDTDQNKVEMDNQNFKVIKSRLPFSHAFKMGLNGLGHKKFKLAMTIFLSLVSFTMLGLSTTFMLFSPQNTLANNWKDVQNYDYFNIGKVLIYREGGFFENVRYSDQLGGLNNEDCEIAKNELGNLSYTFLLGDTTAESYSSEGFNYSGNFGKSNYNQEIYSGKASYIGKSSDFQNKLSSKLLCGNWPSNDDEIVISKYAAQSFKALGYKEEYSKEPISINDVKELLNKSISAFYVQGVPTQLKIVGILDKGLDLDDSKYKDIISSSSNPYQIKNFNEFNIIKKSSAANIVVLSDKIFDAISNLKSKYIFGDLPKSQSDLHKLASFSFKERNYKPSNAETAQKMLYASSDLVSSTVRNTLSLISSMKNVFLIIGLVFVVFSGLLLANFIANSISYQRKEIGILRAIGSRGNDVFKIYMSESGVIAATNFILSTITSFVVVKFGINPAVGKALGSLTGGSINLLVFNFLSVLIILGVSVLAAFASTFIPVYLTAKKKPIDAIRQK